MTFRFRVGYVKGWGTWPPVVLLDVVFGEDVAFFILHDEEVIFAGEVMGGGKIIAALKFKCWGLTGNIVAGDFGSVVTVSEKDLCHFVLLLS